ncbi:class I SAM-dependent methyltransferase [Candidatus Latescibacterota bacterium]
MRKEEEKAFHDRLRDSAYGQRWSKGLEEEIRRNPLWKNMKYYSIERKSRDLVMEWLRRECAGKNVLDYCCGNGEDALFIAEGGAGRVVGVDISDTSIDNCRDRARSMELANCSFEVMDAEAMDFGESTFDVVSEYGALHHLSLEKAYSEIARVLKPDGKCICVEALGHNKIIHMYRKLTPKLRTEWEVEHILRRKDIEAAGDYFSGVKVLGFFHLATVAAVPLRGTPFFESVLSLLEGLDRILLSLPFLRWNAWQVVFELAGPRMK